MKICLLEPFQTGSHATWAEGYAHHSRHDVRLLTLSGRRWKWRMHGGAVTLARQFCADPAQTDLLLASDMLDLTTFLALTRDMTATIPVALYCHENQLTYPWAPGGHEAQKQQAHYAFINYTSALAADAVFFNSRFHLEAFTDQLPVFLKSFPDHNELESVDKIKAKSDVLYLGLELSAFDQHRPAGAENNLTPLILWNHRWEYDKNPDSFFRALFRLQDEGLEFNVAILGESFRNTPPIFKEAKSRLGKRLLQFGYAGDFDTYAEWLWRADILPVTSDHDFFGASVVEAIYCRCTPLLPRRLAYPEHLSESAWSTCLYSDFEDLCQRLAKKLRSPQQAPESLRQYVSRYDWQKMAPLYDDCFEELVKKKKGVATFG